MTNYKINHFIFD